MWSVIFSLILLVPTALAHAAECRNADDLLDELGSKAFDWLQKHRHPETGLLLDRAPNDANYRQDPKQSAMSSVASVGYYLSVLPEAARLGYIPKDEAKLKAEQTLRFAIKEIEHHNGVLYHFIDWRTGKRWHDSEASTLDTAIFLNGCMVVSEAFGEPISHLSDSLLDRVDWKSYLVIRPDSGRPLLSLGWHPNRGLLGPLDVRSSESAMPYFLAIGSRTHSIEPRCWYSTTVDYWDAHGLRILNRPHPLFTSYYGLGWHDLKGLVDRDNVDLYSNARSAALVNRMFCREEGKYFKTYAESEGGYWGISAGDAPGKTYVAPGPIRGDADGIVWPMAALAALPWVADELKADLERWRSSRVWDKINGPYGLAPFQLLSDSEWYARDLIGIDVGSFAVALANYRNRTVWDYWMMHPIAKTALARIGYKPNKGESKPASRLEVEP